MRLKLSSHSIKHVRTNRKLFVWINTSAANKKVFIQILLLFYSIFCLGRLSCGLVWFVQLYWKGSRKAEVLWCFFICISQCSKENFTKVRVCKIFFLGLIYIFIGWGSSPNSTLSFQLWDLFSHKWIIFLFSPSELLSLSYWMSKYHVPLVFFRKMKFIFICNLITFIFRVRVIGIK